jgi:hypothetical protein
VVGGVVETPLPATVVDVAVCGGIENTTVWVTGWAGLFEPGVTVTLKVTGTPWGGLSGPIPTTL